MQAWSSQAGLYPPNECLDTPHAYAVLKYSVHCSEHYTVVKLWLNTNLLN